MKKLLKKMLKIKEPIFPKDAHSFEVFAIKDNKNFISGKEAYVGYKIKNGDFHFLQIPYTGDKK